MHHERFDPGVRPYENVYYEPEYRPGDKDLLCAFRIKPEGVSMIEAASAVAAESSVGTWTDVWSSQFVDLESLKAKVYAIEDDMAFIAYPVELFEAGSVVNIMSSVVGNVFGFKAVAGLRLEDIRIPLELMKTFPGPIAGIEEERLRLNKFGRPLLGGTVKPKLGLSPTHFATVVYDCLVGGLDATKDDENLNSQVFCPWKERFERTMEAVQKAETETGETKGHWLNVTAATTDQMLERAEFAAELGSRYIMVDFLTAGFAAHASIRDRAEELGLMVHVHRAMHAVVDRQPNHGINFNVLAKWLRMTGGDHLHTGTVVGKLDGRWHETADLANLLRQPHFKPRPGGSFYFEQDWAGLRSVFPVASGGIHVGHIPDLYVIYGNDAFFLFGGGTHGHPRGSRAGAEANRAALEAVVDGRNLEKAGQSNRALQEAMELWGHVEFATRR